MSTLKNAIFSLFGIQPPNSYNQIINANKVLFSSFGNDITASDIVKTAVYRITTEVAKCKLKSVVEKYNPHSIETKNDSINATFAGRVNEFCGLSDFLQKVAYLTLINKNCFIYWAYDEVPIEGTSYVRRITRGFYPIENAIAKIYIKDGEPRIELQSGTTTFDLPYADIIHIRHEYGANPVMGGSATGGGDFRALLKNLQTYSVMQESIPKSIKASLGLHGILSMRTVADADKKEVTREEFEKHLFASETGIVATDYEADFTPINISATDIPPNMLSFVRDELLAPFGVSLPIYLGKYTDDDFSAFYQTAIEPLLSRITEAIKITLFTRREIAYGNTIRYYDRLVQSLSFARRQEICEMTKEDGLLSRSERRELLGYEPDNEPDRVSLNFIDKKIANQYQLSTLKNGGKPKKEE